jgi:TIR domain
MDQRPRRSYLVFVSHASQDEWIARRMAEVIERKGRHHRVKAFLDARDLESGDRFSDALRDKLREAEELVVLVSSASVGRDWVRHEIGAAWVLGKRIVGVLDKLEPADVPDGIGQTKVYSINEFDRIAAEIASRARRKASGP